ncbi:hypothetical protein [Streptomyces sp. NBC_00316]|uniref:hypothetical protein n=1 Tax=Streptomyces sp. NBC_00316 TaxID=2975710 RepID=UPI002E2CE927|nr:hypothetical protein [Streptomyces sp. NBC_00316]
MKVRLYYRIRQVVSRRPTTVLVGLLTLGVTVSVWISPKLAVPISTGAAVLGAAVPAARSTRPRLPVHERDAPNDAAL